MKTTKRFSFSIILVLLLCIAQGVHAQATIGSGLPPNEGTLLDLKQDNNAANSTKGLGMPRVKLTTLASITTGDITGVTEANKDAHIGLMVYNTNGCVPAGNKGLYVWDGTQWTRLAPPLGTQDFGTGVVVHPAKAGVYEAFTSAVFGTAGRWMTTNLAAKSYDTNITTATLPSAPSAVLDASYVQWAYPSATSPSTSTEYTANKDLGLLYSYAAVTATCIGSGDEGGLSYPSRQGICPNGWHVPSDKEWTELETEFTANKSKYSTLADDASASLNGTAMKATTTPGGATTNGQSKALINNGFAALLAGRTGAGSSLFFGDYGFFGSSSSYGSYVWTRSVKGADAALAHAGQFKYTHVSVRCKKD